MGKHPNRKALELLCENEQAPPHVRNAHLFEQRAPLGETMTARCLGLILMLVMRSGANQKSTSTLGGSVLEVILSSKAE